MKFKVNQCLVSSYGVLNEGPVYDSADYPEEFYNSLVEQGFVQDISYISSSVAGNISLADLSDVNVDLETSYNAGHMLVIDDSGCEVCCLPKDYNEFENKPIEEVGGTQEEPLIVSELATGIYRFNGYGKISPLSPTNEFSAYGILLVSNEETVVNVTCLYEGIQIWTINKETQEYTINNLIDRQTLSTELDGYVEWSYNETKDKNYIRLENDMNICGADTTGIDYNLIQVSRWNVVDVGSKSLPISLNTNGVVGIETPVSETNSTGKDFVATASALYKVVIEADPASKYYPYNGQTLFNGALANYITATIVFDAEDNISDFRIEVTGQVQ
jgi:hypothetical protein